MSTIRKLSALEILDSRGRPTILTRCELASGATGDASVPSGASTGTAEAHELRDGDPKRYRGLGCLKAVANVEGELSRTLFGQAFDQTSLDQTMLELDGTSNKSRLGANAILGVSLAFARAAAAEQSIPLFTYFAHLAGSTPALPQLTVNLFSGGKHAGGQVPFQDVLLVPVSAKSVNESLVMIAAVYNQAVQLISKKYAMRELKADEGGLAPPFADVEAMLTDAVEAIRGAGLEPGLDMALAVDVASSHFYQDGTYHLGSKGLSSGEIIGYLEVLTERYPVVSLEDGLAEDDWEHWPLLRDRIGERVMILGDDFFCTNPSRISRAIEQRAANALLLKVNQIGTLSEALQARNLAKQAGWRVTVSARSGETEDSWLADLAVAWGDQIKVGSIRQSERLAKYNRLLEIESVTRGILST